MPSSPKTLDLARAGDVTTVTLNRPEKLNAFSAELVDELQAAVTAAATDGTRLLVLRGAGKGFSGGFDLDGLEAMTDGDLMLRFIRAEELLQSVYHAPYATLALVHGACFGAAADVVAACHWRIAAPGARFRMPGPRFGVVLGTRRLTRLVGADAARELLLRDAPFDAEIAARTGFVQRIAPDTAWDEAIATAHAAATGIDAATYAALTARHTEDSRDADMAALVRSVASGSIKARITAYIDALKQVKPRA
ncbi:MAG: enoyl-CoA hydratase/isomerase family protein [Hyphomicrobiaceae bacterium]